MCMSCSFVTAIYFENDNGSTRTLVYRIRIFNAEKKIMISMILFLSVSDYSQASLNKPTQHGTYDYLFNLTDFYSRDKFKC